MMSEIKKEEERVEKEVVNGKLSRQRRSRMGMMAKKRVVKGTLNGKLSLQRRKTTGKTSERKKRQKKTKRTLA